MPRLFSFKPSITFQGPGVPRGSRMGWQTAKRTQVWRTVNAHALIMVTATVLGAGGDSPPPVPVRVSATGFPVLILSVIVALLVLWGSFYWGELAYDYQFNVERLKGSTVWDETQGDEMPGERWRSEG
jgi:hypothetical protein